jgi:hypothetical protein
METNWVFQEPIDFEHKQYVILDYLQKVDKQLNSLKLYPNFQQISFHLANINLIIEKGQYLTLNRVIKDPDDEILISDLIANEVPLFTREEIGEIYNSCVFSSDKLKDYFNQAKAIWEVASDTIAIEAIQNQKNIESKQGLFMIKDNEVNHLYEFVIKPIKKNGEETKCIIKKVCTCDTDDFEDKLKDVKKPLIKNISDPEVYKDLIVFTIYHSNQFPFKETILPLAKRKVMNYMIQSKFISKKNLTNKTQ